MGGRPSKAAWGQAEAETSSQDVVFREATFQVAREILEPHNFMIFPRLLIPSSLYLPRSEKAPPGKELWPGVRPVLPLGHCGLRGQPGALSISEP